MVCVCATGIAVAVTSCRYWAFQRPSLSWDSFHWSSTAKDFISGWVLIGLYRSCRSCWLQCTVLSVSATSGWKLITYCGRHDDLFIMIVYFCHILKEKCHHHVRFNGRFSGAPGLIFFFQLFQKTTIDTFFTGKMPFLSPNLKRKKADYLVMTGTNIYTENHFNCSSSSPIYFMTYFYAPISTIVTGVLQPPIISLQRSVTIITRPTV